MKIQKLHATVGEDDKIIVLDGEPGPLLLSGDLVIGFATVAAAERFAVAARDAADKAQGK